MTSLVPPPVALGSRPREEDLHRASEVEIAEVVKEERRVFDHAFAKFAVLHAAYLNPKGERSSKASKYTDVFGDKHSD